MLWLLPLTSVDPVETQMPSAIMKDAVVKRPA